MTKKILRKWEWIAQSCRELKYEEAAIIADQIDASLLEIYGDQHTSYWKQYLLKGILNIYHVYGEAISTQSCIACVVHGRYTGCMLSDSERYESCAKCIFGRRHGICIDDDSLHSKFMEEL